MTKKRDYSHLRLNAQKSKAVSLEKIEVAKNRLLAAKRNGKLRALTQKAPNVFKPSGFCEFAGLGPNFLNGPSHKASTKSEVENFLDALFKGFEQTQTTGQSNREVASDGEEEDADELKRITKLYEHTRDQLDRAMRLVRELRSEVRQLRSHSSPKVVSLRPQS